MDVRLVTQYRRQNPEHAIRPRGREQSTPFAGKKRPIIALDLARATEIGAQAMSSPARTLQPQPSGKERGEGPCRK